MDQPTVDRTWLTTIPLALFASSVLYLIWSITFSVFYHPLSRFPGPMWSSFTRMPYWIACLTGNEIYFMHDLHMKYGSVVRFSPNELSYTDAQAWRDVFGYQKGKPENLKAPGFQFNNGFSLESENGKSGTWPSMLVAGTDDHARVRRLFSPGFSDRALKKQEPLFRKYVDLLISKLFQRGGEPVDLVKMLNLTSFDLMAELSFGEPLGLLENGKYSTWVETVFNSVRAVPVLQFIRYYPWLNRCFELLEPKAVGEARVGNFRHSAERVDKRLERGSEKPDLWNLVESHGGDEKLTLNEMHANAMIFMIAGTETTATLLSGLAYLLLMNPDKLDLLKKELWQQATSVGTLTFETLAGLKYFNACIQEALRIYPPVPLGVPRAIAVNPSGGQTVCGRWLPSGTRASVHQYAAHHSPANFKDPEVFAPERWLGDKTYEDDQRDVMQPFSMGPRNCLGQNMAWHEMRLIFGNLLSKFDMELCEESRGWINGKTYVLWEKTPLMVRLRRRPGTQRHDTGPLNF